MPSRLLCLAAAAAATLGPGLTHAQADGAKLFAQNCSACHQLSGKGIPGAFPALAGDPFVVGPVKPVLSTVLNGRGGMPSFRNDLSNAQIAAVVSYIRSSWGNHAPAVDAAAAALVRGSAGPLPRGDTAQSH